MKKCIKEKCCLILFISIVIALLVIILSIVCNWSDFKKETDPIVALVGIILAFASILLSYQGLKIATEVKEDIGKQQYRLEQAKIMAELVNKMNKYSFQIISNYNYKGVMGTANLAGLTALGGKEFQDYINIQLPISYPNDMIFDIFEGLEINAYMPESIAILLSQFNRDYMLEIQDSISDKTNCFVIKKMNDTEISSITVHVSCGVYASIQSFINHIEKLLDSINDWYLKNNGAKPNLIMIENLKKQDD